MKLCKRCKEVIIDPKGPHGNRQYHEKCAKEQKLERQKEKYKVGNEAKLKIQKTEAVLARLSKMDPEKEGISYFLAIEHGLQFSAPYRLRENSLLNKTINVIDQYGYYIETINNQTLIFIYHVSEL